MIDKDKQNTRQNKWKQDNQDRIYLNVPKGTKELWQKKAAAENKSLTQYIIDKTGL